MELVWISCFFRFFSFAWQDIIYRGVTSLDDALRDSEGAQSLCLLLKSFENWINLMKSDEICMISKVHWKHVSKHGKRHRSRQFCENYWKSKEKNINVLRNIFYCHLLPALAGSYQRQSGCNEATRARGSQMIHSLIPINLGTLFL